jgi:hypothetical protein
MITRVVARIKKFKLKERKLLYKISFLWAFNFYRYSNPLDENKINKHMQNNIYKASSLSKH